MHSSGPPTQDPLVLIPTLIASPHQAHVTSLDDLLSVGLQRSRIVCLSLSIAESEYIATGSCCAQLLWMKQTFKDYGIQMKQVPLYCNNESAIKIANNPVQHSKTKHIEIHHHFLRDHVAKEDTDIIHVNTEEQLADIFTKPLNEKRFCKLRCELNILESSNVLWSGTHPNTYAYWWLRCATQEVKYIFNQRRHTF